MQDKPTYGWEDPGHWHGGWLGVYVNPDDPRTWVPKRRPGFGWTLNFAHAASRWWLAGIVGGVGLLAVLLHKD